MKPPTGFVVESVECRKKRQNQQQQQQWIAAPDRTRKNPTTIQNNPDTDLDEDLMHF